jgi:hypothetical protein
LKRVLTREQIKSVKKKQLWPELFANDDTEYTNKISGEVKRTITPDDLLKIEEKLRIESGGKKKKNKQRNGGEGAAALVGTVAGGSVEEEEEQDSSSEEESESEEDDSLPPLHKNTNWRPSFVESSDSDSDSEEESSSSSSS